MITVTIGVLVGVIHLLGYWIYYNISSTHKETCPNTASWSIWAFGSIVNLLTYSSLSNDWVKDILPAVCSLCCITVFITYFKQARFQRLDRIDFLILSFDIIATVVWLAVDSALMGNIACEIGTLISYVPIIKETIRDPKKERPHAWIFWSIAYCLDLALIVMRWNQWSDIIYPATNLIPCMLMAIISIKGRSHK